MSKYKNTFLDEEINKVLDGLAVEYKELLIEYIMDENRYRSLENISIRDIVDADNGIKKIMTEKKSQRRIDKYLKMTLSVGLMYSIIGIFLYIITSTNLMLDNNTRLSMTITMVGLLVVAITLLFKEFPFKTRLLFRRDRENEKQFVDKYEIIEKWNEIEKLSYELTHNDLQENNYVPIGRVISKMVVDGIITEEDRQIMKGILNIRNSIVHPNKNEILGSDLIEGIRAAEKIINKLNRMSN
ncbi:hypothetical protein [Clostridium beijerinckii]|uniref:hypothetical protein n=1 Tax=Clostridium beijerinckii TaxID=1520 RepID=UPI00156FC6DC|nr:hypothetical protein [Clostridium beijerinckii]NRT75134.1 hypothetical protein [Clostridium beijerinckii]